MPNDGFFKSIFFLLNCLLPKAYEITTMYKSNTTKSIKTFFATLFSRRLLMYPQLYCFFLPFFKQSLSQIFTNQLFTASSYSTPSSSLSQKQTRLMQKEKKLIFFLISKLFYVWPTFTWRRKKNCLPFFFTLKLHQSSVRQELINFLKNRSFCLCLANSFQFYKVNYKDVKWRSCCSLKMTSFWREKRLQSI